MSVREKLRRAWPHVRAALVSFHVIAIVLAAIPAPAGGMNRRNWKDPTVQAEFQAWGGRLGVDPKSLEDALYRFAKGYMSVRDLWLKPVDPYLELTGTDQPWRMFVAPHRHPSRFRVEVATATSGPEWELLFEERNPDASWRASFFEDERIRSILFRYSWPEYSSESRQLCRWIARRVFEERPDADRVQCRYRKARSPSPRDAREGVEHEGTWSQVRVVPRTRAPLEEDRRRGLKLVPGRRGAR